LTPAAAPAQSPALPPGSDAPASFLDGLFLTGEFLLIRPQREGLDFAVVSRPSGGSTLSSLESLSWDATPAFRIGGGYRLPDSGVELAASFTYLHTKTQRSITAPDGGSLFGSFATNPAAGNATHVDGDADLTYGVVDLDIAKSIRLDDSLGFKVFGGVRLASIDQSLKAIYTGGALGDTPDYVNSPIHFRGAGLTAGAEGTWNVYRGWGIYGRGRLALVSGQFDGRWTEAVGPNAYADARDVYSTVIPVVELGAGVNYQGEHFFCSAGYEVIDWIGMVSGVGGPDTPGNPSGRRRGDLTLEALSLKLGFVY
jgi:hypothetical protein